MSAATLPPMAAPPPDEADMDPAAGAPDEEQAVAVIAAITDQLIAAAVRDPETVKQIIKTAVEDPEIRAMLAEALAGGEADDMDADEGYPTDDDFEALASGSDDVGELTDDDLALMMS